MVRGRDACWEHCVLIDATRQKVRCNYCQREFSGGVYRMKFHLAQIKNKDIVPCTEVPDDVRDQIQSILSMPKKQKAPKKQKVDQAANGQQNSSSGSEGVHPNHGSSGQNGSSCPSLLFPRPTPNAEPTIDDAQKQKQDDADKKIAKFFFHNSISFSAAKSMYYQEMLDAVAECGVGYKGPNYEKLRSTLLERVKGDIHDFCKKLRVEWKETGCTILCDGWSDGRTKSIIVFSAACSKGTLFLKSIDVSGHADDAHYLFEVLASVVLEVGVENVVQVVTDSTASFVYAGRLLMAKYPSLFWSPCASHCINKMLEDFSKQEWVSLVLEEASTVARYIHRNSWTLNMMRKFTGGRELIRPKISRFVANFLSLRSIVIQEDNLKHMFSHSDWSSSMYSRRPDAQAIKCVLYSERFWKSAHEAVSVSEPLVKILRIVDGDMPAMGYMHEGMERAKIAIKVYYKGIEEKYVPIWDIIDRRWNMQLHSPLHAAAAFLNPSIFYNLNFKIDSRIKNGFQEAMLRIASEDKDKNEITKEHPIYINAQGALGTDFAIIGRTLNAPGDWWMAYGYEIPTLQRAALRILSQPCSSHWCRWNWSTFENIHLKKRNRPEVEKLSDLVFVHCNLWLQAMFRSRDWKCKSVIFDDIDVGSEWPTESESSTPLMDDSWLDNIPFEGRVLLHICHLDLEEGYCWLSLGREKMDMVVGGTDTTASTIEMALAEMINKPEVMNKSQQEVDMVVGSDSIVEEYHLSKLPYLYAVMKEVLRLHPAVPLLVPRCPSKTCIVGGYTIPKGTRVLINAWAIHRDPSIWVNPLEFIPERFMDSNYKLDFTGNDFRYFPFGSGRRICAGIAMAERMFLLSLAALVHSFDWKLPEGEKLDLSEKFGIVLKKKIPLVAVPTPRLSNPALYEAL